MKRALVLAGGIAILALPAFAQNTPVPATPPQNAPATASPAASATPSSATPSTADFVKNAAMSGMFEIQSSKLALQKKVRADRKFAGHMIHDHEHLAAQLKHLVKTDHVDAQIPTALDDQHQKMLDQLRGESGATFDKDYDAMQQQGHQEAVSMFQSYSQNGDNPALKKWAAKTLPELQDHLAMARKLS
jgi:putative membrane protein